MSRNSLSKVGEGQTQKISSIIPSCNTKAQPSHNTLLGGPNRGLFSLQDGGLFVRTVVQLDPDSDLFMKVAQSAYRDHERSLVPCTKCGRTFFPDRIEIHQRNCATSKLPSESKMSNHPKGSNSQFQHLALTPKGEAMSSSKSLPKKKPTIPCTSTAASLPKWK